MKKIPLTVLLIIFTPSLAILFSCAIVSVFFNVDMGVITRDVTATANINALTGILSNLGILLWCSTATICLFSALTLRNTKQRDTLRFLLSSSLLSTYLLFDDLFQFHERLAPKYLGINEKLVLGMLAVSVVTYLIVFRLVIFQTCFSILLLALGFLSTSIIFDVIPEQWYACFGAWGWQHFFEDGFKWLGIASWCGYYAHVANQLLDDNYYQHSTSIPAKPEI
jgi:hypothetical protein